MTHPYVWHDSSICVAWLRGMCDMNYLYVWHDPFLVIWQIKMMNVFVHLTFTHASCHLHQLCIPMCKHVRWRIHMRDMTHQYLVLHTCDMTHSYMGAMLRVTSLFAVLALLALLALLTSSVLLALFALLAILAIPALLALLGLLPLLLYFFYCFICFTCFIFFICFTCFCCESQCVSPYADTFTCVTWLMNICDVAPS